MDAFEVLCEAAQGSRRCERRRAPRAGSEPRCACCPTRRRAEQRVGLLLARAQALTAAGRLEESRADLLESIALVPEDAVQMRVMLTVGCAGAEHMLGRYREARARITAALEELPDEMGPEAVSLRVVLAFDGLFRGDLEAMRGAASVALESARAARRPVADRDGRIRARPRAAHGTRRSRRPRPHAKRPLR